MSSIVEYQDLFDRDGILKALADLTNANRDFAQSVRKEIALLRKEMDAYKSELKSIANTTLKLKLDANIEKQLDGLTVQVEKLGTAKKRVTDDINLLDSSLKLNEISVKKLKTGVKALEQQFDALEPKSEEFAQNQQKIAARVNEARLAINSQTSVLKTAKGAIDAARGSYNALSKETQELKKRLQSMPGAFNSTTGAINKTNREAAELQKRIEANTNALKRMDAQMGNHQRNVGNYGSALSGLRGNLLTMAATLTGVGSVFEAVFAGVQVIDRFERLDNGLKAVTDSTQDFNRQQEFAQYLADLTGQEVEGLRESLNNFTAATRGSVLEGQAANAIYASFTKTFAALGRTSETARRGLLAVEQMVSKNKVSSEELRQQLGEALPGAVKLFADALGVTTGELEELMKDGKVLASDVLPKVAAQLETLYGPNAQNNLNTISGSWTDLTNQIKLLLAELNKERTVSGFFSTLNKGLADAVRLAKGLVATEGLGGLLSMMTGNWGSMARGAAASAAQRVQQQNEQEFRAMPLSDRVREIQMQREAVQKRQTDFDWSMRNNANDASDRFKAARRLRNELAWYQKLLAINGELIEAEKKRGQATGGGEEGDKRRQRELTQLEAFRAELNKTAEVLLSDAFEDLSRGTAVQLDPDELAKFEKLYQLALKLKDAFPGLMGGQVEEVVNLFRTVRGPRRPADPLPDPEAAFREVVPISEKEKKAQEEAAGARKKRQEEEGELFLEQVNRAREAFDTRRRYERLLTTDFKNLSDEKKAAFKQQLDYLQKAQQEGNERMAKLYEENVEDFIAAEDRKRQRTQFFIQEGADLAQQFGQAAFDVAQAYRDRDSQALQAQRDHSLRLAGDNAESRAKIEENFEKKQREIRLRQAKAERAAALFSIAINTAAGVASVLSTGGGTRYADLGISAGLLTAFVLAQGGIQAAAVLAKPLPAFARGTENAPEGPALVGEKGPELGIAPDGTLTYYDRPQVADLQRGTRIKTATETREFFRQAALRQQADAFLAQSAYHRQTATDIHRGQAEQLQHQFNLALKANGMDYARMESVFVKAFRENPFNVYVDGQKERTQRQAQITRHVNARNSFT